MAFATCSSQPAITCSNCSHAMYILATNVVLSTYIAGVQDKFRNKKISKFATSSKITCGKRDRSNHEGTETESSKDYTF